MKYSQYIRDGFLAWTLTSNGYKYMTWNLAIQWSKHVKGVPLCIVCADKPSYQFLQREGISCILWDTALADFGPQIVPFGSRQFSTLNRLKLKLLDLFANDEQVNQCLYLDGDIAVYKDIVGSIKGFLEHEPLWMPCDEQSFECSTGLHSCPNVCTGLVAWNKGADKGIFKITDEELWSKKPEDQVWVNIALHRIGLPYGTLPRDLYPNGARVTKTHTDPALKEKAVCLHYNWRVGDSKKIDMKRFGDWHLPY
jgi:hypothetical protein